MKAVHYSELACITFHRLPLQLDRRIDVDDAIGKQRSPHFVAAALELHPGAAGGCEQHSIRGPVIGMTLQQKGQVDDVGPLALQGFSQPACDLPVIAQTRIFRVEKVKGTYSKDVRRAPGLRFANRDVRAKPAVCQKYNADVAPRPDMPGNSSAASEDFVVHVGRKHNNPGFFRFAGQYRQVVDR